MSKMRSRKYNFELSIVFLLSMDIEDLINKGAFEPEPTITGTTS